MTTSVVSVLVLCLATATTLAGQTYHVATDGSDANDGLSAATAFGTIAQGLAAAGAGDVVIVGDGEYHETINTPRAGATGAPVTLRAANPRAATILSSGQRHFFDEPNLVVEGFVFDGQAGDHDIIRVTSNADSFVFRNNEVRNGARDAIDLGSNSTSLAGNLNGVLIEASYFHHLLWWDGLQSDIPEAGDIRRKDAHAIAAGGVNGLTIRNTIVDKVSGDALQLQDGFWNDVALEGVDFRNTLLAGEDAFVAGGLVFPNGTYAGTPFENGVRAGENAIDTKQDGAAAPRGRLTVANSRFTDWGEDGALIFNPAALNLKEEVEVIIDGNLFADNAIGLRLRGPATATDPDNPPDDNGAVVVAVNNVFHDHDRSAIRLEDHLQYATILNNTFGDGLLEVFEDGGGSGGSTVETETLNLLNNLFLGAELPSFPGLPLLDDSNLAVDAGSFRNVALNDYALIAGSAAIDAGADLFPVTLFSLASVGPEVYEIRSDHLGLSRLAGGAVDVGAFEFGAQPVPLPVPAVTLLSGCLGLWLFGRRRGLREGEASSRSRCRPDVNRSTGAAPA